MSASVRDFVFGSSFGDVVSIFDSVRRSLKCISLEKRVWVVVCAVRVIYWSVAVKMVKMDRSLCFLYAFSRERETHKERERERNVGLG